MLKPFLDPGTRYAWLFGVRLLLSSAPLLHTTSLLPGQFPAAWQRWEVISTSPIRNDITVYGVVMCAAEDYCLAGANARMPPGGPRWTVAYVDGQHVGPTMYALPKRKRAAVG